MRPYEDKPYQCEFNPYGSFRPWLRLRQVVHTYARDFINAHIPSYADRRSLGVRMIAFVQLGNFVTKSLTVSGTPTK